MESLTSQCRNARLCAFIECQCCSCLQLYRSYISECTGSQSCSGPRCSSCCWAWYNCGVCCCRSHIAVQQYSCLHCCYRCMQHDNFQFCVFSCPFFQQFTQRLYVIVVTARSVIAACIRFMLLMSIVCQKCLRR